MGQRHAGGVLAALVLTIVTGMALMSAASSPRGGDDAAIRELISAAWDTPEARVIADPIAVAGEHAIASWTHGRRGGRALLRKTGGQWRVVLCGGDALKEASALQEAGLPASTAVELAAALNRAETAMDAERRALLSTFEGVVRMDRGGGHEPHR